METLRPFLTAQDAGQASPAPLPAEPSGEAPAFCWEYRATGNRMHAECRTCMVFKARAKRCYLLAELGFQAADEDRQCGENCADCAYFQEAKDAAYKILLVTDRESLKQAITRCLGMHHAIRAAASGYETAAMIHTDRPDCIIIDSAMPRPRLEGLLRALRADPAAADVQIVLAVRRGTPRRREYEGTCGILEMPCSADTLKKCLHDLQIALLGLHN